MLAVSEKNAEMCNFVLSFILDKSAAALQRKQTT